MKTVKTLAVASAIAVASTSAFAGGLNNAQDTPPLLPPVEPGGSSAGSLALGSLGSLGGAAPAIIAAVAVAAAAAAGGS